MKPEPYGKFKETLNATAFGSACPQYSSGKIIGDEDCLTLNIYVPDTPNQYKVIFMLSSDI